MLSTSSPLPYQPCCRWNGPSASHADIYQQLPIESFRVLCLNGYTDQGVLTCTLHGTSFAAAPTYTAISYTWNEADQIWYGKYDQSMKPIWIDKKLVRVADKVANVLCLAWQHGRQTVWIDSICIDQSRPDEKNRQVAYMGQIYSRAMDVLCFLSRPTSKTDALLDNLRLRSKDKITEDSANFARLITDNYWSRAWTLQEVALAQEAYICCGSRILPLKKLIEFDEEPSRLVSFFDAPFAFKYGCHRMLQFYRDVRAEHSFDEGWRSKRVSVNAEFFGVLLKCQGSRDCSDPRDLLYSRLALTSDSSRLVPFPDYSLSVEELYKRFATNCILLNKSLDVVACTTLTDGRLPTWVPDWRNEIDPRCVETMEPMKELTWQPGGDLPRISRCRTELMVQGRVVIVVPKGQQWKTLKATNAATCILSREDAKLRDKAQQDDMLCVLKDCPLPVLLRPMNDHHIIVGKASRFQNTLKESRSSKAKDVYSALGKVNASQEVVFKIR